MLSSVLRSARAIATNIAIMRAFMTKRLRESSKRLRELAEPPPEPPRRSIGFVP